MKCSTVERVCAHLRMRVSQIRRRGQVVAGPESGCGKTPPSEDGEAMRENATDPRFMAVRRWVEIYATGRQHKASGIWSVFALDLPLQSIEIDEVDGDDVKTANTLFPLRLKAKDREIKQQQRPRCMSSIALIRTDKFRSSREARRLRGKRGIERNIYRTPMRTPRRIHSFEDSQGHGNRKSEGIANASKKCRPKYIGSRWARSKRNSSRRHIA
jgi:hypothetical protein